MLLRRKTKPPKENKSGWTKKLRQGLSKTHRNLVHNLERIVRGKREITPEILDEIEELLISADLGMSTSQTVIDYIKQELKYRELKDYLSIKNGIQERLLQILGTNHNGLNLTAAPAVIMVLGVNGGGKTTTIGKLAYRYQKQGKKVLLAAADTFRAAAVEQLKVWGQRSGAGVIGYQTGADPAAVVYDAAAAAKARGADILIIDTAGRLHTKKNLMEELKKMKRVVGRCIPGAPHETLLVLDATTGQNAIIQARQFHQDLELSGLVLTKLDGTAKGGVAIAIVNELDLPIKLIGVGEGLDDLQDFEAQEFISALFEGEDDGED